VAGAVVKYSKLLDDCVRVRHEIDRTTCGARGNLAGSPSDAPCPAISKTT
jgi:hypothetical protein